MEKLFKEAIQLVLEAGELIKSKRSEIKVSCKGNHKDLVTNIDVLVEEFFYRNLKAQFSKDFILGEEGVNKEDIDYSKNVWVIDPIDGTVNFIHQGENYAVSLGYVQNGEVLFGIVYDVFNDKLYTAKKGCGAYLNGTKLDFIDNVPIEKAVLGVSPKSFINNRLSKIEAPLSYFLNYRYYGCASLEIIYVGLGKIDCYIHPNLKPWDFVAAKLFLEELGGVICSFEGQTIGNYSYSDIIASNPILMEQFFSII